MLHELLSGLSLAALMTTVSADDLADQGRAGQDLAETLLQQSAVPVFVEGGERQLGIVVVDDERIPVNQIIPGGDKSAQQQLMQLEGDEDALSRAAQARLADQSEDSGDAATVLRDVASHELMEPKEFLADHHFLMEQSVLALTAPLSVAPEFPACQTETHVTEGTTAYTTFRERTCERINRPTTCTRSLQVEDLSRTDATFLDEQIRFDHDERIVVSIADIYPVDARILSANLQLSWAGPASDVSILETASADNDWRMTLQIVHDANLCTSCLVNVSVRGSVRALRQTAESDPEDCLVGSDEFCSAVFNCDDAAPRLIGGAPLQPPESLQLVPLYPRSQQHQPPDALAPVCYQATARYECRIRSGEFCADLPAGRDCAEYHDSEGMIDTCAPMLVEHPDCSLARSSCAEGGSGHGEWCYVESDTYRCAESVVGQSVGIQTVQPCSGQIRCAGDDCLDRRFDENAFDTVADGMAGMMIAQAYASDWQDTAETRGSDATPPRLFPGKAYECRKALGATINCCDQTETDVEQEWFSKYQRHMRRANATDTMARYASEGPHGSWKTLAESGSWSQEQLSKALTSGPETVSGGDNPSLDPDAGSIVGASRLLQPMNDEFREESRFDHMGEVGWACSAEEFDLANQRELGHCLSIGSYCHHNVLGACLDKRDVFCCFNSAASRSLREAIAGPSGVADGAFGTARDPLCHGVLVEQARMESLDITDLKGRLKRGGVLPDASDVLARSSSERLTGSGSNLADTYRPTVQQRTQERLSQIPGGRVRDALYAQGAAAIPSLQEHKNAGQLSFSPAYFRIESGRALVITVLRQGTAGEISAEVTSGDSAHWPEGMPALSQTLVWADGQSGFQRISLPIPRGTSGEFQLRLTNPTGGATLYPNDQATVKVVP